MKVYDFGRDLNRDADLKWFFILCEVFNNFDTHSYRMRLMQCSKQLVTSISQPCSCRFLRGASSTWWRHSKSFLPSGLISSEHSWETKMDVCWPPRSRQCSRRWQQLWPELRSSRPGQSSRRHGPPSHRSPDTSGQRSATSAAHKNTRRPVRGSNHIGQVMEATNVGI